MANIDKISVKNTVFNIVSPAVVSDYIEVIGGACTKPDGYEEDEVILAKQNDVQLLFKATQDIAFGANIVENTNCVRTTLEEVLKNAGGGGGASSADQVSYDNSASGLEAENVQEAIDEVQGNVVSVNQTLTNEVTDISDEIADMNNVLGAKNLLNHTGVSDLVNGVTYTVNADKSISTSGASTVSTGNKHSRLKIYSDAVPELIGKTLILSGCPADGGSEAYDIHLICYDSSNTQLSQVFDQGSGATITIPNNTARMDVYVRCYYDVDVTGLTFKPMIRPASIKNGAYVRHAMTNQELTPIAQAVSNRNLLDNPWFTVNQRGQNSYTGTTNKYGFDRWLANSDISKSDDIITFTSGMAYAMIRQRLDKSLFENGKTYTFSFIKSDGSIASESFVYDGTSTAWIVVKVWGIGHYYTTYKNYTDYIEFGIFDTSDASETISFKAVKLELGSVSTLAQDTAPNYATELLKCQRYFKRIIIGERIGRVNNAGLTIRFGLDEVENMRSSPTATEVVDAQTEINISGAGVQFLLTKTTDYTVSADRVAGILLNLTETGAAKLASYTNQIVGIWNYNQYLDISADL